MRYAHILSKFYYEPWAIRPDAHATIGRALHARLHSPRASWGPENDEEPDREAPELEIFGGIAIVPIHGILGKNLSQLEMACGGCDYSAVSRMVDQAAADPLVHTIILDLDTPGGMIVGMAETAARIAAAREEKTVLAWCEAQCCSAGYRLAIEASEIYCTPSAIIGSIGTYSAGIDESRAWENEGYKLELFRSGNLKAIGIPGKAWTDEERAYMQAQVDRSGAAFRAAVSARRPGVTEDTMQGQWFDGDEAATRRLADSTLLRMEDLLAAILALKK